MRKRHDEAILERHLLHSPIGLDHGNRTAIGREEGCRRTRRAINGEGVELVDPADVELAYTRPDANERKSRPVWREGHGRGADVGLDARRATSVPNASETGLALQRDRIARTRQQPPPRRPLRRSTESRAANAQRLAARRRAASRVPRLPLVFPSGRRRCHGAGEPCLSGDSGGSTTARASACREAGRSSPARSSRLRQGHRRANCPRTLACP